MINKSKLDEMPDFVGVNYLVELGLYTSVDTAYLARKRKMSPDFIKIGRKVLYPKDAVMAFISKNLHKGSE